MELMNCRNCKRLFNYITGEKLCPDCKKQLEEKQTVVEEVLGREEAEKVISILAPKLK